SLRTGKGGGTKGHLYTQVRNGLIEYGKNIWFDSVFTQAQNIIVEEKDGGFTYYPRNKHVDNDDILDAFGFALIALEASPEIPMEVGVDVPVKIKKIEPNHDAYGNIYWEEIEIANRW